MLQHCAVLQVDDDTLVLHLISTRLAAALDTLAHAAEMAGSALIDTADPAPAQDSETNGGDGDQNQTPSTSAGMKHAPASPRPDLPGSKIRCLDNGQGHPGSPVAARQLLYTPRTAAVSSSAGFKGIAGYHPPAMIFRAGAAAAAAADDAPSNLNAIHEGQHDQVIDHQPDHQPGGPLFVTE